MSELALMPRWSAWRGEETGNRDVGLVMRVDWLKCCGISADTGQHQVVESKLNTELLDDVATAFRESFCTCWRKRTSRPVSLHLRSVANSFANCMWESVSKPRSECPVLSATVGKKATSTMQSFSRISRLGLFLHE